VQWHNAGAARLLTQSSFFFHTASRSDFPKGLQRMKKRKNFNVVSVILAALAATLLSGSARATLIELGRIDLTGDFTLNHNYNFNDPAAFPFGTFGLQTVQTATGIFAPYISNGDSLTMNTPFMFGPISPIDSTVSHPMTWSIGGFTIDTQDISITGADFVGRYCSGVTNLSGNGFDPAAYPFSPFSIWNFIAPPYDISNFPKDVTGPINLAFVVTYDDGQRVPEGGATIALLSIAIFGMFSVRRMLKV
jgi:hypothetical protein